MGFLRRLFGSRKHTHPPHASPSKTRWTFAKQTKRDNSPPSFDANNHAVAVAAAAAEAALAAAHAAAEVVRLTSTAAGGRSARSSSRPPSAAARAGLRRWFEETAAVKIQSAFRGYLAKRALRALKSLVKLQALVRGHIVRKQTADMLRRMQTLVRLQSQARASRAHLSDNNMHSFKSSPSHYPVPEEYEHPLRAHSTKFDGSSILKRCSSNANFRNSESARARFSSNWLNRWMEENDSLKVNGHPDDEKSDKILEVDTWKPNFNFHTPHCYNLNSDFNNNEKNLVMAYESPSKRSSSKALNQSLSSLKFNKGKEEASLRTADNSPQPFSSSSRHGSGTKRGAFTPTRSECSWGFFGGYAGHPNYMANTESSRAKVRSQSAPRQRLEFDRYGYSRMTVQSLWDVGPTISDRDSGLRNKAYPASSRFSGIGSTNLR